MEESKIWFDKASNQIVMESDIGILTITRYGFRYEVKGENNQRDVRVWKNR